MEIFPDPFVSWGHLVSQLVSTVCFTGTVELLCCSGFPPSFSPDNFILSDAQRQLALPPPVNQSLGSELYCWVCVYEDLLPVLNGSDWPLTSPVASEVQAAPPYRTLHLRPHPRSRPVWSGLAFQVKRQHFLLLIWWLLLLGGHLTFSSLAVRKCKERLDKNNLLHIIR